MASTTTSTTAGVLAVEDPSHPHRFEIPSKKIHDGKDVEFFLTSRAYTDLASFIIQLNHAMCPQKYSMDGKMRIETWDLTSTRDDPPAQVLKLQQMLRSIDAIIDQVPPAEGPRRFGNISFRTWHEALGDNANDLLQQYLEPGVLAFPAEGLDSSQDELKVYLLGSFGSSQRLDYGTGHELSFLAFLAGIWKLGGFGSGTDGSCERSIVVGVIELYLRVIRRLILTYTLEPAGSHGVWGLDDHSFLPYILGSAQYCPPINHNEATPVEGSLPGAPNPSDIIKKQVVDELRSSNMYFSAIGFINDVKTGPFWEHSPLLFDISGIKQGWGKINKGMIKMFHAEVLSKFPVVQHFPFGSLFRWEHDPSNPGSAATVHMASQPSTTSMSSSATGLRPQPSTPPTQTPRAGAPGMAPWARPAALTSSNGRLPMTAAPWARAGTTIDPSNFDPSGRATMGRGTARATRRYEQD